MNEASRIADEIARSLPNIKRGMPRFYGDQPSRRESSLRAVTGAAVEQDCLVVTFDGGETLKVWNPRGCEVARNAFVITSADRVRWEWLESKDQLKSKDQPTAAEPCYRQYSVRESGIRAETNVDRFTARLEPKVGYPAFELC